MKWWEDIFDRLRLGWRWLITNEETEASAYYLAWPSAKLMDPTL